MFHPSRTFEKIKKKSPRPREAANGLQTLRANDTLGDDLPDTKDVTSQIPRQTICASLLRYHGQTSRHATRPQTSSSTNAPTKTPSIGGTDFCFREFLLRLEE